MRVLSSYRLSDRNNRRIDDVVRDVGGVYVPTSFDDKLDDILDRIEGNIAEADIFLGGRLTQEQFDRAHRLQWIHVPWAGVNALMELRGVDEREILITNSSGVMADSVADQVMAYMVMLNRSLPKQLRWQRERQWNRYTSVEHPDRHVLRGMTAGLIGYGSVGRAVAERCRAFGMRVVAVKRCPEPEWQGADRLYGPEGLHRLFRESDIVVVALPLTTETRGMIGWNEFEEMKRSAFFVNVARGPIVDQIALERSLQSGSIAGAALDVFNEEPLSTDSPLWGMENVIITPHSSGGFVGFGDKVTEVFLKSLSEFQSGSIPGNRIDPKRGY